MSSRQSPKQPAPASDIPPHELGPTTRDPRSGIFPSTQRATSTPRTETSVGERTTRIGGKIELATELLRGLHPSDPRARLLGSAILRRDETLLDAVLARFESR